jgi:hypothetical protein
MLFKLLIPVTLATGYCVPMAAHGCQWEHGAGPAAYLEALPLVVFMTVFSDHAGEAFDLAAADYPLKPVCADRLAKRLERLRGGRTKADRALGLPLQVEGRPGTPMASQTAKRSISGANSWEATIRCHRSRTDGPATSSPSALHHFLRCRATTRPA